MTNNVVGVDVGGVKTIIDSNTVLVRFTLPGATAATTTLYNSTTNTQYIVPVGKKCSIIYLKVTYLYIGNGIIYADNLNGTTNAVNIIAPSTPGRDLATTVWIYKNIPAGKYINFYSPAGLDAGGTEWVVFGVEENV